MLSNSEQGIKSFDAACLASRPGHRIAPGLGWLSTFLPAAFLLCAALLCTALFCTAGGCNRQPDAEGPALYPVSGTIRLNGRPVDGADVVFRLQDGSSSSFARTDATGSYRLTTRSADDGAPAGDYTVTVSKTEAPAAGGGVSMDDPNYNPYTGRGAAQPPSKPLLPGRHGDPQTSTLRASVKAEGENRIDFDL